MILMPRDDPTCPATDSRWRLAPVAAVAAVPVQDAAGARKVVPRGRKVGRRVAGRRVDSPPDRVARGLKAPTPRAMDRAAADDAGAGPAPWATDRSIHRIVTTARPTGPADRGPRFRVLGSAPADRARVDRGGADRAAAEVAAAGPRAGRTPADHAWVDLGRPWVAAHVAAPIPFPAAVDHRSRAATAARAMDAGRLSKLY